MPNPPVIFVPGIFGSFNLPVLLDWRAPTLSGWGFPPFVNYGKTFLDAFRRAGYVRDRDLFVAFYDWRKSAKDTAQTYLVPWIDRARSRSGSAKVVLVGHSMGGLVSRSYIQSSNYRDDVERLITLGTPHRGSPEAYYAWGGGDIKSEGFAKAVFDIYLWYLEHANPLASELDHLKTIRTLVPAVRDLLPIDDYLFQQDAPAVAKPENQMRERNLWGDILNRPEALDTLFGRVPVTVMSSLNITTLQSLIVKSAPEPPSNPTRYPDGEPVDTRIDTNGDGTVPLASANLGDPRARCLPPLAIRHADLPDSHPALEQIFAELNSPLPRLAPAKVAEPNLVIMSASPVDLIVEEPSVAPGVLGAAPEAHKPTRAVRARNFGHSGKHLNMAIISNPVENYNYTVQVRGTGTGSFALGALIVGAPTSGVLGATAEGAGEAAQPISTEVTTASGHVTAETTLHYQISCPSLLVQPEIRFDTTATARNLLDRLGNTVQTPPSGVLGSAETAGREPLGAVLGAASDTLRDTVEAALVRGDAAAMQAVVAMLASRDQQPEVAVLLGRVAEQLVSTYDSALAVALMEQLKQIVEQG